MLESLPEVTVAVFQSLQGPFHDKQVMYEVVAKFGAVHAGLLALQSFQKQIVSVLNPMFLVCNQSKLSGTARRPAYRGHYQPPSRF